MDGISIINREKAVCSICGEGFSTPEQIVGPVHINKGEKPHEWALYHADCNPFKGIMISIQAKRAAKLMEVRKWIIEELEENSDCDSIYSTGRRSTLADILEMTKLPREVKDE